MSRVESDRIGIVSYFNISIGLLLLNPLLLFKNNANVYFLFTDNLR